MKIGGQNLSLKKQTSDYQSIFLLYILRNKIVYHKGKELKKISKFLHASSKIMQGFLPVKTKERLINVKETGKKIQRKKMKFH